MCCDLSLRVSTEVNCGAIKSSMKDDNRRNSFNRLMVINTIRNADVCTVHFVQFTVFVQQMHNICIQYLFLIALLLVSMYMYHLQGVYFYVC